MVNHFLHTSAHYFLARSGAVCQSMLMAIFNRSWRKRAEAAEAAIAVRDHYIAELEARTRLIDIQREGRWVKFVFMRGPDITQITTIGTWDDDIEEWKRKLLL
jgi:hypothetical protein